MGNCGASCFVVGDVFGQVLVDHSFIDRSAAEDGAPVAEKLSAHGGVAAQCFSLMARTVDANAAELEASAERPPQLRPPAGGAM